jgi:hypothetical protein
MASLINAIGRGGPQQPGIGLYQPAGAGGLIEPQMLARVQQEQFRRQNEARGGVIEPQRADQ